MAAVLGTAAFPKQSGAALLRGLERFLLRGTRGALTCAALLLATTLSIGNVYLHDEGLYTYELARGLLRDFPAFFFWVKGKPPLLLLYALPAQWGYEAYLVAHCLVGAATVLLVIGTARAMELPYANLAGWMLATSTAYAVTVSNGVPNPDGAAFLALFFFLYFSRRHRAAALVLGTLPFVRHELALVTAAFVAWELWRRRDLRFLAGAAALPALYLLSGALYHGDLLWIVRLWINPSHMPEPMKLWRLFLLHEVLDYQWRSFVLNSPWFAGFAVLGAVMGVLRRDRRIVLVGIVTVLLYGGLALLQLTHFQPVGLYLRAHVALLPLVALLAAWGLSRLPALPASVALRARWPEWAPPGTVLRLLVVVVAVTHQARQLAEPGSEAARHQRTHQLVEELTRRGVYRGQPLFTDINEARYDRCARLGEVTMLANSSIEWELRRGATAATGQADALLRHLGEQGLLFDPGAHEVRRDAVYLLLDHSRVADWQRRIDAEGPTKIMIGDYVASFWPPESP